MWLLHFKTKAIWQSKFETSPNLKVGSWKLSYKKFSQVILKHNEVWRQLEDLQEQWQSKTLAGSSLAKQAHICHLHVCLWLSLLYIVTQRSLLTYIWKYSCIQECVIFSDSAKVNKAPVLLWELSIWCSMIIRSLEKEVEKLKCLLITIIHVTWYECHASTKCLTAANDITL